MIEEPKTWRPHEKQEAFLTLPDEIFEALYGGAAFGGKSEVLLLLPLVRGFLEHPKFKGLLLRRTFPELEKSLILRSHEWFNKEAAGGTWNSQSKRWRFPSGAILDFGHLEYESDVYNYKSAEYNYIGFDELTTFTQFQYIYLLSRCRTSDPTLPKFVRAASNPGDVGHGWVRERFVEPAKLGNRLIKDKKTGTLRIFIPARLTDNPYGTHADPDYANRLEMLPEAEKRALLWGDWWTFSGQVFDEFRAEHFPGEPDNAVHVIDPFNIPDFWPRVLAIDWGYAAMMWAGWGAVAPDSRVYVYREHTAVRTKISTWAKDIARLSQYETLSDVVLDPSAWSSRGDDKTIAQQFQEHSGLVPRKADNDRIGGKILFHEFLRWEPSPIKAVGRRDFDPDLAARIFRVNGEEYYKQYLASFQDDRVEEVLPRLQIFRECKEVIKAIPLCVYADVKNDGLAPEDVKEWKGDDPYDGCRYLLKAVDVFCKKSKRVFEKKQVLSSIISDLTRTGDQTSFYRRMEALESRNTRSRGHRMFGRR